MEESLRGMILKEFPHEEIDIRTYSPASLAFLGDAVYSLVIRTILISKGNRQVEKLHNETTFYVRAEQQAAIGDRQGCLRSDDRRRKESLQARQEFKSLSSCQEFFTGGISASNRTGSPVRLLVFTGQDRPDDGTASRGDREDGPKRKTGSQKAG